MTELPIFVFEEIIQETKAEEAPRLSIAEILPTRRKSKINVTEDIKGKRVQSLIPTSLNNVPSLMDDYLEKAIGTVDQAKVFANTKVSINDVIDKLAVRTELFPKKKQQQRNTLSLSSSFGSFHSPSQSHFPSGASIVSENSILGEIEARHQRDIEDLDRDRQRTVNDGQRGSVSRRNSAVSLNPFGDNYVSIRKGIVELPPIANYESVSVLTKQKNHNFKANRNPVLDVINSPGVLEVDSSRYPVLPKLPRKNSKTDHSSFESDPNPSPFFIEPKEILFESFKPRNTFCRTLTVTNVSLVAHRFRVTFDPPESYPELFKLSLAKTPTDECGLIAPGMSIKYNIYFTPRSSASATESLIVYSETGDKEIVKIKAFLEPPVLNLPNVLDIGYCIDQKRLLFQMELVNTGGEGRFIIMSPNVPLGPEELFEELGEDDIEPEALEFGPFQIFPSYFRIKKGGSQMFEVSYTPAPLGHKHSRMDTQHITFALHNCTTFNFQIVGKVELPCIYVTSILNCKTGLSIPPISSDNEIMLDFEEENVLMPKFYKVIVKNVTHLRLEFCWSDFNKLFDSVQDDDLNAFRISPSIGVFEPLGEVMFQICFLPPTKGNFQHTMNIFHMDDEELNLKLLSIQLNGHGIDYSVFISSMLIFLPVGLYCGTYYKKKMKLESYSLSELKYDWNISVKNNMMNVAMDGSRNRVLASQACLPVYLRFEPLITGPLSGEVSCVICDGIGPTLTIPIIGSVQMQENLIYFNVDWVNLGILRLGDKRRHKVWLVNDSAFIVTWNASFLEGLKSDNPFLFLVQPSFGTLDPKKSQEVNICYIPLWYHQLRGTLQIFANCTTADGISTEDQVLVTAVTVVADALTPHLVIENSQNAFSTFCRAKCKYTLVVTNTRSVPAHINWKPILTPEVHILFDSPECQVGPYETLLVPVSVKTYSAGLLEITVSGVVDGMVENGSKICFELSVFSAEQSFVYKVLENQQAWDQRAEMKPTRPLNPNSDANLRLDFGMKCPIFLVRKRTLVIRNHTSVAVNFDFTIENYKPTIISEVQAEQANSKKKSEDSLDIQLGKVKVPLLVNPTHEPKSGFSSKAGQAFVDGLNKFRETLEIMKRILSDGRGAAFKAQPSSGVIPAWGEATIEVSSYNNMVGIYKDTLICHVGETTKQIAIRLGVVGSAVKLTGPQLVAQKNSKDTLALIEMVNFGSRIINSTLGVSDGRRLIRQSMAKRRTLAMAYNNSEKLTPTKTILVENHSPRDIRLDWRVFVRFTQLKDGKEKNLVLSDHKNLAENDDIEINEIFREENMLMAQDLGVLDVSPSIMHIPAFKSAILSCHFRNCTLGNFDALVFSDIEYRDANGQSKWAPQRTRKPGEEAKEQPILKEIDFSKRYTTEDLLSIAKLRIKGKCIEPRLSLDIGSKIRIKHVIRGIRQSLNTVSFLVNDSDAVCEFKLACIPDDLFSVGASKEHLKDKELMIYTLKQKQSMMITVKFIGDVDRLKPSTSQEEYLNFSNEPGQSPNEIFPELSRIAPPTSVVSTPGSFQTYQIERGDLAIYFTNGMVQLIPITLDAVTE